MTITKTPRTLHPVYSNDNIFRMSETGATYFIVTITGSLFEQFTIYPNTLEVAELNIRYVLENYIYSQIIKPSQTTIPNGIKSYTISVTSDLGTTTAIGTFYYYNGKQQCLYEQELDDGDIINNIDGGINVFKNDVLTIQKYNATSKTFDIVDISPNGTTTDYSSNGVDVHILEEDERFDNYRFAYVNQWGGTDYVNFSKSDRHSLSIKKSTFISDNSTVVYDTDVTSTYEVYSDFMSEEESKRMEHFFTSPLVNLIKDGDYFPVNLTGKSISILRKKEEKLISYKVEFEFLELYNTQK